MKIIPPNLPFQRALRIGYVGEIRMDSYLVWIRTQPCWRGFHLGGEQNPIQASHPNFYKSQANKGPDPLALPECRIHHEEYEIRGDPMEQERLAAAALYLLQAIVEGRLVWKNI